MKLLDFVKSDHRRGLFPLRSNIRLIELGESAIRKYVAGEILDPKSAGCSFQQCPISYALKDPVHLRRTLILDAPAMLFLYDFVLTNRKQFTDTSPSDRRAYGYCFAAGKPQNPTQQYRQFRRHQRALRGKYTFFAKTDVANCFNSFYHHDFAESIERLIGLRESQQIGQFLREINAGTTINCFPQGLFPAKALGNQFLRFIENSQRLNSDGILRFLDDTILFSNKRSVIHRDILTLQQILGTHALALNAEKTHFGESGDYDTTPIESIKKELLKKRAAQRSYDADEDNNVQLKEEEREYLQALLGERNLPEEDVELALSLLRDDPEAQMELASVVLQHFPHLIKSLYGSVGSTRGYDVEIFDLLAKQIKKSVLTAFELFWIARIVLDHYEWDSESASLLIDVFNHPSADATVKSAVLESSELSYGIEEIKVELLRQQPGGIVGTAAMVGIENMGKGKRNQIYKYAAKAGNQPSLLCHIMSSS